MRKYNGILVHRSKDPLGPIEVIEDGYTRSLHFGNAVRQSTMDLHRPEYPVLTYTRAMLSALLLQPSPQRALLIGLGGGSLAKFLLHHFPECMLDAVEPREHVIKIAHGYFLVPEDQRLRIHLDDGDSFVQRAVDSNLQYDLIMVDAFDDMGIADAMAQPAFFNACSQLLTPSGVMASNLWGDDRPRYTQIRRHLRQCFGSSPLLLDAEGTTNVIAISSRHPQLRKMLKNSEGPARTLESLTGLEFLRMARALRKRNRPIRELLFPL